MKKQFLSGPYLVWMALFTVIPLVIVLYYAFTDSITGGFTLKNITQNLTISAKAAEAASAAQVDESVQCQVTCTGCTFTYLAGGLKGAVSGSVPAGAVITVMAADTEAAARGYSINGGAVEQVGKNTFRLTITEDTTIVIP